MDQQGFVKILLIVIIIVVVGTVGYFMLIKKAPTTSSPEGQGAYIPTEEEIIRVLFPKGGERLEIGKTYEVRWKNYIANEPLTIGLQVTMPDGRTYLKRIVEDIPVVVSGTYNWTVTSELADSKYKIEVYPESNRPLVGRSKDFFSITGDSLVAVNTPQPLDEVTSPIEIIGKARRIFSEGEFIVKLVSWGPDSVVSEAIASISNECDWMVGDWCNFKAKLSFPSGKGTGSLEFYQKDERFGLKLVYKFPVYEKGTVFPESDLLIISSPLRNQEVTNPIIITGKARKIFFEGEFRVNLMGYDYPLGHPKYVESSRVITSTYARIVNDCDWLGEVDEEEEVKKVGEEEEVVEEVGNWCDFRAEVNYSLADIGVEHMLYFYDGGQGEPGTPQGPKFILALPLKLK